MIIVVKGLEKELTDPKDSTDVKDLPDSKAKTHECQGHQKPSR